MNQIHQNNNFRYNPNLNRTIQLEDEEEDVEFTGVLDIFVHHASNIHNICIYDNQDVYAKFSLTYDPDEILSTRIINKGGKNPTFNESLRVKVTQMNAVMKCEIWMFSRSKIHMEDQLLGFALVPISQIVGKGKVTQDYSLSSTDLFHSPVGIVKLTLSLDTSLVSKSANSNSSLISSEVIFLDRKVSQVMLDPIEYSRIEFPDISVVKENQEMVYEYFNLACASSNNKKSRKFLPFLHLGKFPQLDDYEMTNLSSPNENPVDSISISLNEVIQNPRLVSSTITSLSDDRNSANSIVKKNDLGDDTPTSNKEDESRDGEKEEKFLNKEKECKKDKNIEATKFGQVFSSLGNINLEAEECAMQKQIVDMYMRSMQQFTESLAKMKLPIDLDKPQRENHNGDVMQNHESKRLEIDQKKKDGSRVFYGSRAFF